MTALLIIAIIACSLWFTISLAVTVGDTGDVDAKFSGLTSVVLAFAIVALSIALGNVSTPSPCRTART
jgi:hypothetical protein